MSYITSNWEQPSIMNVSFDLIIGIIITYQFCCLTRLFKSLLIKPKCLLWNKSLDGFSRKAQLFLIPPDFFCISNWYILPWLQRFPSKLFLLWNLGKGREKAVCAATTKVNIMFIQLWIKSDGQNHLNVNNI